MKEMHFNKNDFKFDWFSGKGAGGQHHNKPSNCCKITHIITGFSATGQSNKSRVANQREAFNNLAKHIIAHYNNESDIERFKAVETIRNYHAVRNEVHVHDKASGLKQTYKHVVIDGDMGDMVNARRATFKETIH